MLNCLTSGYIGFHIFLEFQLDLLQVAETHLTHVMLA